MFAANKEKLLKESDISRLIKYLDETNFSSGSVFVSPYLNKGSFNELSIRDGFFNYSILPFVELNDDCISILAYFKIPIIGKSKAIQLELLTRIDNNNTCEFVKWCINYIKCNYTEYTKVSIALTSEGGHLSKICNDLEFKPEAVLRNEFGINNHLNFPTQNQT